MGSRAERTCGKAVAGRPSEGVDCGAEQARLQLADPTRWWLADPTAPHLHTDKQGGMVVEQSRQCKPRAPGRGKKASNL